MRRIATIIASVALFISCDSSQHKGYKWIADDVHLRLLVLGDGLEELKDGDSIRVRLRATRIGEPMGSYLSTENWYLTKDLRNGALSSVLAQLHEGDSVSIITHAGSVRWATLVPGGVDALADTTQVQLELSILLVRTPAMILAEAEQLRRSDPEGYERRLMAAYRRYSDVDWTRWGTSEMYYAVHANGGDTTKVGAGDGVTITYRGIRVEDGGVFDDTERNGESFVFRFGDTEQVIKGLEVAVTLLREGQEGTFLIPSTMAFGTKGITGILDPNMPVVYTVRLVHVDRAKAAKRARQLQ